MINSIAHNRCDCGWKFFGFVYEKKCPQCKPIIDTRKLCVCCGAELSGREEKYCPECKVVTKKIYNRVFMQNKRTLKDVLTNGGVCDYDCHNCKFADCIIPADEDQGELF